MTTTPDVLPALASDEEIATFAERLKVYHEADVIGIKVGRGLRILARLDAAERDRDNWHTEYLNASRDAIAFCAHLTALEAKP